jgi:hypothetical protein
MKRVDGQDGMMEALAGGEMAAMPDRLPWPLAALVIAGSATALWMGVAVLVRAIVA